MALADFIVALVAGARNELLLFAGVGLLLGGLDDLVLDGFYGARRLWRAATVYRRFPRMTADRLPPGREDGTMAVFIPAWDERGGDRPDAAPLPGALAGRRCPLFRRRLSQ